MISNFLKGPTHGRFRFPWCFARIDIRSLCYQFDKATSRGLFQLRRLRLNNQRIVAFPHGWFHSEMK